MDSCFLIFAGICISPLDIHGVAFEFQTSPATIATYENYDIKVFSNDHLMTMDSAALPKVCKNNICVTYHQYCDTEAKPSYCKYEIQRSDRNELLTILAESKAGRIIDENWRNNIKILMGTDSKCSLPLDSLSQLASKKEWPKARVMKY